MKMRTTWMMKTTWMMMRKLRRARRKSGSARTQKIQRKSCFVHVEFEYLMQVTVHAI